MRNEVKRHHSLLHDVLVALRTDGINLIADIVEYQCIDEAMSSFREVVGQVEIGDPGSGPFQLRSGGNRCQRHFRICINVRSVQAERELIHSVCRTA